MLLILPLVFTLQRSLLEVPKWYIAWLPWKPMWMLTQLMNLPSAQPWCAPCIGWKFCNTDFTRSHLLLVVGFSYIFYFPTFFVGMINWQTWQYGSLKEAPIRSASSYTMPNVEPRWSWLWSPGTTNLPPRWSLRAPSSIFEMPGAKARPISWGLPRRRIFSWRPWRESSSHAGECHCWHVIGWWWSSEGHMNPDDVLAQVPLFT